ncbi:hypothetical protein GYMLUDRAFT_45062 [Collybiopsis luxurians FD-317 M1]|uniref:F-box domain-containing protein n=1 Tax=Collybiopsis luxurians FD-317 M1 TaxID=944289 RepID=A0A0D0C8B7_9AGAR|nr:hypothetical protein GYMLUDRAFT_45062 [Collybiopsis luxurians FD-317 M1]
MSRARSSKTRNTLYRTLNQDGYVPESILPVVRECVIREWDRLHLKAHAIDALLTAYSNSLPRMNNITSLILINVTLTPSFLLNMRELSRLTSLALHSCDFGGVTARHVRDFLTPLNLEKFELDGAHWEQTSTKDVRGIRAAFISAFGNLFELKCDQHWPTRHLSSSSFTPPLQVLDIRVAMFIPSCVQEAIRFILKIPTLVSLTINDDTLFYIPISLDPVTECVSLSSFPQLRHLNCPPSLVSALVGQHNLSQLSFTTAPLESYTLTTSDVRPALSQMLSRSDAWFRLSRYQSIQELHIPVTFAQGISADANGAALSQLKKLTIDGYTMSPRDVVCNADQVKSFATTFATPSLRHLRFINMPFAAQSATDAEPKQAAVLIQEKYFTGLNRFSLWFTTGDRWEFMKDPVNEMWGPYDPGE